MGCQQSSSSSLADEGQQFPSSIDPLWDDTAIGNTVKIEQNKHEWNKRTLKVVISHNRHLTATTSRGGCMLLDQDQTPIAVFKRRRGGFGIYQVEPVFPGQLADKKYKGFDLYLYAAVTANARDFPNREGRVKFVNHERAPQSELKLCFCPDEKSLSNLEQRTNTTLATWTTRSCVHTVSMTSPNHRALILCLVILGDFLMMDAMVSSLPAGGG